MWTCRPERSPAPGDAFSRHGIGWCWMYEYPDIEFAMCGIRVLMLMLVVVVVAFATRSRVLFITGSIGALSGFVVPEHRIMIDGTAEACFLARLDGTASHILLYGAIGAVVACVAAVTLQHHRVPSRDEELRDADDNEAK